MRDDPPDLAEIVTEGDVRRSYEALRDRLAHEANDTRWAQHKRECSCVCGMGDGRTLVAIVKELRVVIAAIDALPGNGEVSELDRLAASVDELAPRRSRRRTNAASS